METVDKVSDLQQPNAGVCNKQIVHVRGDSETELDLLFSVLNSREQKPPIRSFREMNLPPSFFRPPDPKPAGYHSREGSLDGASIVNQLTTGQQQPTGIFHSRSHSSPAQLPLVQLSVAASPNHLKQGSAELPLIEQHQVRQPGWPQNNNKYYTSNSNVLWTASDTHRSAVNSNAINSSGKQMAVGNQNGHTNLGPLPAGWEQGVTAEGDIYYINHIEKTTSWFDPRLPKNVQKSVPVKVSTNNINRSARSNANSIHTQPSHSNTPVAVSNEQLIRIELQKLQKEKERLLREQEDNLRKEQLLLNELAKVKTGGAVNEGLHHMVSTGVDPFLGQSLVNTSHADHSVIDNNSDQQSGGSMMDMPLLGVDASEPLAMDSDDLVPSFTGELSMDDQMMENMIQYI